MLWLLCCALCLGLSVLPTLALSADSQVSSWDRPTHYWELSQSVAPLDAWRLTGYIGAYDQALPEWWRQFALFGALVFALIAVRSRVGICAIVIYVVGAITSMGLNGPLASVLDFVFRHSVIAAYALRELYNFSALSAVGLALIFALAATEAKRPIRLVVLALIVSTVVALLPTLTALPYVSVASSAKGVVKNLQGSSDGSRYLATVPGQSRVPSGPFSLPIAGHPYFELNSETRGFQEALEKSDSRSIESFSQAYGVSCRFRIARSPSGASWSLAQASGSNISTGAACAQSPRAVVEPYINMPGSSPHSHIGINSSMISGGVPIDITSYDDEPRKVQSASWLRVGAWPEQPSWLSGTNALLLTTAQGVPFPGTAQRQFLVVSAQQPPSTCRQLSEGPRLLKVWDCDGRALTTGPTALIAAWRHALPARATSQTGGNGSVRVLTESASQLRVFLSAERGSALVVADRFSPFWNASEANWQHVTVNGYANAWLIPVSFRGIVTIDYRLRAAHRVAIAIVVSAFLLSLVAANASLVLRLLPKRQA